MLLTTSVFVAATAGSALAVDLARDNSAFTALPVFTGYDASQLVRTGTDRTDMIDTDVNMGAIAWDFDTNFNFVTGAFIEGLPDVAPINGGTVTGGPSLSGTLFQSFSYVKDGFIPGTGFQHTITFHASTQAPGFLTPGFTFTSTGTPADYISIDMGTSNVGNAITHANAPISIVSGTMDILSGGGLLFSSDMLIDPLSFFGTDGANGFVVQAFTPPFGTPDISPFGIDRLEMSVTYITAPTPASAALFGLAGLAGIRRRRH